MKRQFYFDDVERDLLRCALELFRLRLGYEYTSMSTNDAHFQARTFALRRINELLARLAEPTPEPEQA